MKLQRLLSLTRQAVDDYRLIQSGDKIAIGISGGKDSLTLLYALQGLRRFYPEPFELCAITVDLGLSLIHISPTILSQNSSRCIRSPACIMPSYLAICARMRAVSYTHLQPPGGLNLEDVEVS